MAALLCILVQSCEYVDFFEPYEVQDVAVRFEWMNVDTVPKSMRVVLYPADEMTRKRIKQGYTMFDMYASGRSISVPIGNYNVLSYNTDTEHIQVEGYEKPENLYAYTSNFPLHATKGSTRSLLDSLFFGLPLKDYPSYLVSSTLHPLAVNPDGSNAITLPNSPVVRRVKVRISNIRGFLGLRQTMLALAPIHSKARVLQPTETSENSVLFCDAFASVADSCVTATFNMFDSSHTENKSSTHRIVLLFWLNTGNIYIPLEIGNIEDYYIPEENLYHINLEGLDVDLRDYVTRQDGFDITVDDWDEENIEIGI